MIGRQVTTSARIWPRYVAMAPIILELVTIGALGLAWRQQWAVLKVLIDTGNAWIIVLAGVTGWMLPGLFGTARSAYRIVLGRPD